MSAEVLLLVLLGAALHASWNALVKSGADKLLDTARLVAGGALVSLPALLVLPLPAAASWPFLAASAVIHLAYFALVAEAYRAGDMSLAYPLMRGTPPLIVALLSGVVLGEHLSPAGWLGILLISGGVLALALKRGGKASPAAVGFALMNALVIAAYTLVDGLGARLSGHAVAYTLWVFALSAALFLPYVAWRRPGRVFGHLRAQPGVMAGAGVCTVGSYALALWAMTQAPIALVAALRETSILFAVLIGWLIFGERMTREKAAAALIIVAGVMLTRL